MNIKQKRTLAIIVGLVVGISIGGGYYANKLSTDPTLGAPTKIDISTQTNLEATSPVVLTNDTLSINLASSALEIDSTASISGAITLGNLISCDTIDSDANGLLSCGTDATGAGGNTFSNPLSLVGTTVSIDYASASGGGYLTSTDWTTFNNKQVALTFELPLVNISNTVSASYASAADSGWLSSTDWTTFNAKQAAGDYITALTGDVTATGPGSVAATIAANSVALTTDTTGNYVLSIADDGTGTVTVINGTGEGLAATLKVVDVSCTDCLNATEIEDIYFLTAGDNASASVMTIDSADITSASFGTIYAGTWNGAKIDVSDYTNFTAGTGFDLDGDTLNADFSEFTLDTSLLGGDMIPFWEDTGGDEKKISWTNMQASIDALGTITADGLFSGTHASLSGDIDIEGDLNVASATFGTTSINGGLTTVRASISDDLTIENTIIFNDDAIPTNRTITVSDQANANSTGNALSIIAGKGNAGGPGGVLYLTGGAGGTTAGYGTGGRVVITGGAGGTGGSNEWGGNVAIIGGVPVGSGTEGYILLGSGRSGDDVRIVGPNQDYRAIFDAFAIATTDKIFAFPNISGTFLLATGSQDFITSGLISTTHASISDDLTVGGGGIFSASVSATNFYGALTGNASTATALANNGANCNAGNYPLGIDASGAVEGCTADAGTTYTATNPLSLVGTAFSIDLASAGGDGYLSGTDWGNFNTAYGWGDWSGEGFITAADVPANETDSAHDTCGEVTGCVVGAITASASVLTVSVEANIVSLSADTYWGAGLTDCDNATTSKLLYSDTGVFSCGTDQTAAGGVGAHMLLSDVHNDSVEASVSAGSLIYGNATPAWAELNIGASNSFLLSDGTTLKWNDVGNLTIGGTLAAGTITEGGIAVLNNDEMDASSELLTIIDDETGTGVIVFGTSPQFTTSFTTAGAFAINPGGTLTIGDGGDTLVINTSDWGIDATGIMTNMGAITTNGLFTGTHASLSGDIDIVGDLNVASVSALAFYGTITGDLTCTDCLNATEIEDIYLLDDGDVGTGAYDFGGASLELPNGTSITLDANGEAGIDTTAGQFNYYSDEVNILMATESFGFAITSTAFDLSTIMIKRPDDPITITAISCICKSATSVNFQLVEGDANGANGAVVDGEIVCAATNTEDDGALSNAAIDAGDWLLASVSQASGECDVLSGTVYFKWTAQ